MTRNPDEEEVRINAIAKAILIGIMLALSFIGGMIYNSSVNTGRQINLGRELAIREINALLKSQWYSIRFRQTEYGEVALIFPARKVLIKENRIADMIKHDIYAERGVKDEISMVQ